MSLRVGRADDVEPVLEVEGEAFGDDAWSRMLVEESLSALLVEEDGAGRLAAYAVVTVAGEVADLQRIAVRPALRRRGLARGLVLAAADTARAGGADRLMVEVRADNRSALDLYAALGLSLIDRRRRYYRDGTDALVLSRPLRD